jgi:putative endonuclease
MICFRIHAKLKFSNASISRSKNGIVGLDFPAGWGIMAFTMKTWYTYIVRCSDGTFYTGSTNQIKARVNAHNSGKGAKYTRSRRPVTLVWKRRCKSRGAALSLEHKIKRLSRGEKEAMI